MAESTDTMAVYNALDAANTLAIQQELWPTLLGDTDLLAMYDQTIDLYNPLMFMMSKGMRVDREALEQTRVSTGRRMDALLEEIYKVCGKEVNPLSPKQVAAYFYMDKNIKPYTKRNAKGDSAWTVDDLALARIARGTSSRRPFYEATLMQQYRGLSKLKGTYFDTTFDADGRFRCSYKPRGTRFSRLSSSETVFGTGTNMQNLPPEFKSFLYADEGCLLIELDKRQAEWVVVAYLADEENMIKIIREGGDPHAHTARQIMTICGSVIPADVIVQEDKMIKHSTNPDEIQEARDQIEFFKHFSSFIPRTMSIRQMGKKSNHGLNYREGYKGFALINEMSEGEAKLVVDGYNLIYPNVYGGWHERVKEQLQTDRTIRDLYGRKYRFLNRFDDSLWKAAISCAPQSTVGHLVNRALIYIYRDRQEVLEPLELLANVHDSILSQYPVDRISDLARAIYISRDYLEPTLEVNGHEFVIPTDLKIGYSWGDMIEVDLGNNLGDLEKNLREGVQALGKEEVK